MSAPELAGEQAPPPPLTSGTLQHELAARYRAPEWAYFAEVRDATGFNGTRTADGVAMNLYPSKGLALHGFEIKVARSDWLRELEQAGKALAVSRYCDHWWVVAPKKIVRAGELPPQWGLLEYTGDGLRASVQAPKLDAVPLARGFIASLLRNAQAASASEEQLRAARRAGRAEGAQQHAGVLRDRDREIADLRATITAAERALGVPLDAYAGPTLAGAYRIALNGGADGVRRQLEMLAQQAARVADSARQALRDVDGVA